MPAPYGITPTGFSAKTLEEIKNEIDSDCRADISPIVNLDSNTVLGQYNGIMSSKLAEIWEQMQIIQTAFDPNSASDAQLSNVSLLTGTKRKDSTYSQVYCTCNLDAGTYAAGALIANVLGNPSARFANVNEVTSGGGSVMNILFRALTRGPVAAPAGTLTVRTPATGWNSVTNPNDADLGANVESDPALRLRRAAELAAAGSASDAAMLSAVSKVAGVETVFVFSNDTDATDSNGLPPHSQEIIVYDGLTPNADDDEIAQAIWDNKTGGIYQTGTTSGSATDAAGATHTVKFTRVSIVNMYVTVDLEYVSGYIGDANVKTELKTWGDTNLTIGRDVRVNRIVAAVMALSGVQDVSSVKIGTAPSPASTVNYSISPRQIAALDTSRIVINSTPATVT